MTSTFYPPLLGTGLGMLLIMLLCYTAGRMHQWYVTTSEREAAYREGYDTATKSLFSLAARTVKHARTPVRGVAPAPVSPAPGPTVTAIEEARSARHRAEESGEILPETKVWQTAEWDTPKSA